MLFTRLSRCTALAKAICSPLAFWAKVLVISLVRRPDAARHDKCLLQTRLRASLLFEGDAKTSPEPDFTFNDESCVVLVSDPLRECKSESRAAQLTTASRINAVKTLKEARQMLP